MKCDEVRKNVPWREPLEKAPQNMTKYYNETKKLSCPNSTSVESILNMRLLNCYHRVIFSQIHTAK
jgi:hypothetical protein